jgi:Tfp pilus assembly protein PilP
MDKRASANSELKMTQTMRRIRYNLAIGLLLLASSGTLHAQVNPATVKAQAQNGVNQAQQTQATSQTQPKPKTSTQNSQQGTGVPSNPPAKTPATSTTPGSKPAATNTSKAPAPKPQATATQQTPKKPATTSTTVQNQKIAPTKPAPPKTAPPTPAKTTGTQAKQTPPKTVAKPPAKAPAPTPAADKPVPPPVRRDPFVTLVTKKQGGEIAPIHLPPGKAGLQVNTLVIQGIISSPGGMIAVVANPQKSVYFLHPGDELFDGRVEKIDIDGVTFHEVGKDSFGKPLERSVTRKLNSSLGEQP